MYSDFGELPNYGARDAFNASLAGSLSTTGLTLASLGGSSLGSHYLTKDETSLVDQGVALGQGAFFYGVARNMRTGQGFTGSILQNKGGVLGQVGQVEKAQLDYALKNIDSKEAAKITRMRGKMQQQALHKAGSGISALKKSEIEAGIDDKLLKRAKPQMNFLKRTFGMSNVRDEALKKVSDTTSLAIKAGQGGRYARFMGGAGKALGLAAVALTIKDVVFDPVGEALVRDASRGGAVRGTERVINNPGMETQSAYTQRQEAMFAFRSMPGFVQRQGREAMIYNS